MKKFEYAMSLFVLSLLIDSLRCPFDLSRVVMLRKQSKKYGSSGCLVRSSRSPIRMFAPSILISHISSAVFRLLRHGLGLLTLLMHLIRKSSTFNEGPFSVPLRQLGVRICYHCLFLDSWPSPRLDLIPAHSSFTLYSVLPYF
jgi:hypothetical protein